MAELVRPSEQELRAFAALLSDTPVDGPDLSDLPAQDLLQKLDYHGITLLAADKGHLPESLSPVTTQRRAQMVANSLLKQNAIIELFDALLTAGVANCVLFKGSALAHSLYPQPWLRPRSDTDCLVDLAELPATERVLESLGYQKLFAIEGRYVSYQATYSKPLVGKSTMDIDLHWRISNRQALACAYSAAELKHSGTQLSDLSSSITIPSNVDSLLIASLHRLGHHLSEERLAWLYDIHLLASSFEQSDWSRLIATAKSKHLCAITRDALILCETLLGTDVPAIARTNLTPAGVEPSALLLQRDLPEWRYVLNDLRSMNSFSARVGFVIETIFPSPDYIRQRMGTRSAVIGYIKRCYRGIKRVFGAE